MLFGSAIKNSANRPYNFTKFHSSVKRKKFKEMTSQSQARTPRYSSGLPRTAPFISCHTFSVAVFLCQFHRQSLFFTASQKPHHFPCFSAGSSARFVWQFLSIPTHHPIRILFFIKISLDNNYILLYNIARFYEKLFFKKRITFMNEKEIMTVKQVSEYLQMDEHTVYKLARSGLIPSLKIAGQWRL